MKRKTADEVMFKLSKAARTVEGRFPYYSPAANRVRFRIDNENTSTMAIGMSFVISVNEEFVNSLHDNVLTGVVLHEIMHYVHSHHERYMNNPLRSVLPHNIHNIAMDL